VTVTATPVPLVAVADPSGASTRYRVTANLEFRETAGRAAKVTALQVTVSSAATLLSATAWTATVREDVAIAIEANGTVGYTLPTAFDANMPDASARWRLEVAAADADGRATTVAPIDVAMTVPAVPVADATFVGAGDMAGCGRLEPEATAKLVDRIPGTVFTAGDNVYPSGTPGNYANCYGPTWGRHLWRTFATAGNHDVQGDAGAAYSAYFGSAAGPSGLFYYSFTLGAWHIVMLNSNMPAGAGTPQYEWLRADLAATRQTCIAAVWHHPLFSSGVEGNQSAMKDVWRILMQYGAELVMAGHDHTYERFAPQDADGRANARGIREFIVGTGGYSLYDRGTMKPNSEVFENRTWGVLRLTLKTGSYDWEFIPIAGQTFRDFGSGSCVSPAAR
jgi:hypothetical protein